MVVGLKPEQVLTLGVLVPSPAVPNSTKKVEDKKHRDCADVYQAGFHKNGVYTIYVTPQETKKVRGSVQGRDGSGSLSWPP